MGYRYETFNFIHAIYYFYKKFKSKEDRKFSNKRMQKD